MYKKCPTYTELLKLIISNINELSLDYISINLYEISLSTKYHEIYIGKLTNLFTLYPHGIQYTTESFRKFGNIVYVDKNGVKHEIPKNKEEWFSFSLIHNCTKQDYDNFIKIMEYISK